MSRNPSRRVGDVHAVVTGAASGIGRSLVQRLASQRADVVCADIDGDGAARVAADIVAGGGRAAAFTCDVGTLADVEALARFAEDRFGAPANYVVNNAGIGVGGEPIGELAIADWQRTLHVNLWGVIHGCHVFVPGLRALGRGTVINIASAASFASAPRMAAYNVTKAGVLSLSETLAAELSDTRVRVSVVCPTFVKTAIVDKGDIDEEMRSFARRAMALTGRSPDRIARQIVQGHEAGTFMIVPQLEARLMLHMKRRAPGMQQRLNGLLARSLGGS